MSRPGAASLDAVLESEVFPEIIAAADEIVDLPDAARPEAWASSILAIWREPGSDVAALDGDRRLLDRLAWEASANAAVVAASLAGVMDPASADRARAIAVAGPVEPVWAASVGTARVVAGHEVTTSEGDTMLVLTFQHDDGVEHTLMADVDGGVLTGLNFGPPLDLLLAEDPDLERVDLPVEAAAARIETAWLQLLEVGGCVGEDYLMNHLLAERRLRSVLGERTRRLAVVPVPAEEPADPERAELDAWALGVLRSAVARPEPTDAPPELVAAVAEIVRPTAVRPGDSARAAQATLEWADWLGVALGLVRTKPLAHADPASLIDLINRCPEVTSEIPRRDRPLYEWAFSVILAELDRCGAVAGGRFTEAGVAALVLALERVWDQPTPNS